MDNIIDNITIERLDTIEKERERTMADENFQQWCKDMKIGVLYHNREGINRANELMAQWSGSMSESEKITPSFIRRIW